MKEEETKRQLFGLIVRVAVFGRLLVICGCWLVVYPRLLVVCARLCSFALVLCSLPVLVITTECPHSE